MVLENRVAAPIALRAQLAEQDHAVLDALAEAPVHEVPKRIELRWPGRPRLHRRQPRRAQVLPDRVSRDGQGPRDLPDGALLPVQTPRVASRQFLPASAPPGATSEVAVLARRRQDCRRRRRCSGKSAAERESLVADDERRRRPRAHRWARMDTASFGRCRREGAQGEDRSADQGNQRSRRVALALPASEGEAYEEVAAKRDVL